MTSLLAGTALADVKVVQQVTTVEADTGEDPTEGIRAHEYLTATKKVDFIILGSIDDVSLGWLPGCRNTASLRLTPGIQITASSTWWSRTAR